ncbi:MAG: beta-lactamase [Patescibacteria group bacterium]|jgi:CubicO group peptidase (beta-lactamase class C family)|nr:beta-lactamase [Patescibacteria group bacterium]
MHTNQIARLGESTGLGWELNFAKVMGGAGSDQKFGKTGFTGCLVVIDPKRQAALVHLSNLTWPHRPENRDEINAVRRALADVVLAA